MRKELRFDGFGDPAPSNRQIGRALIEIAKALICNKKGEEIRNTEEIKSIAEGDFDKLDGKLKE